MPLERLFGLGVRETRFSRMCLSGVEGGGGGGPVSRFNKMTIYDLKGQLSGRRFLVRVDFNVTDPKTGEIKSDTRIKAALPTIKFLREQGAIVILASHNERPKDLIKKLMAEGMEQDIARKETFQRLSLRKAAKRLGELLENEVLFLTSPEPTDPINPSILPIIEALNPGRVVLLENTRFYEGDEKGDENLARKIVDSTGAQIYVNDAFAAAHRDHASVTGIARIIQERGGLAVAGHLMRQEIEFLGKALIENPARPYVAFMGGAKVGDKIKVIERLLDTVDALVIGGAMVYPFLRIMGLEPATVDPLGRSDEETIPDIEAAQRILGGPHGKKILLPLGFVKEGNKIKDVHPELFEADLNRNLLRRLGGDPKTIVWNGPFGQFEVPPYDAGTRKLLEWITFWAKRGAVAITGGGDTEKMIKVARKAGVEVEFSHISTGGGAMLELLEGRELPGIAVLNDR